MAKVKLKTGRDKLWTDFLWMESDPRLRRCRRRFHQLTVFKVTNCYLKDLSELNAALGINKSLESLFNALTERNGLHFDRIAYKKKHPFKG